MSIFLQTRFSESLEIIEHDSEKSGDARLLTFRYKPCREFVHSSLFNTRERVQNNQNNKLLKMWCGIFSAQYNQHLQQSRVETLKQHKTHSQPAMLA